MKPITIEITNIECSGDPEGCLIADCVECGKDDGSLWHAIVSHLVIHHPMPWTIDHDWMCWVNDANGVLVMKLQLDADAQRLIALAEKHRKRMDEFAAEHDAWFAAELAKLDSQ